MSKLITLSYDIKCKPQLKTFNLPLQLSPITEKVYDSLGNFLGYGQHDPNTGYLIITKEQPEQKLIDIIFQIGFTVARHRGMQYWKTDQIAEWIRSQLKECGFDTKPMGASHGILTKTVTNA